MADEVKQFKIKLVSVSDNSGTREMTQGLEEVAKKTGQASEATHEHGKSMVHAESAGKAFHKALHEISAVSPEVGIALRLMMSPVVGALIGATVAFEKIREHLKEMEKESAEVGKAAESGFGDMKQAMFEAGEEVKKQDIAYADWAAHFGENTKQITEDLDVVLEKQKSATEQVRARIEAEKALYIEQIKLREAQGQISSDKAEFEISKIEGSTRASLQAVNLAAMREQIATIQATMANIAGQESGAQMQSASAQAGLSNREVRLKALPGEIESAKRSQEKYEEFYKKALERTEALEPALNRANAMARAMGMSEAPETNADRKRYEEAKAESDRFLGIRDASERFVKKAMEEQSRLTEEQDKAGKSAEHLKTQVESLGAQYQELERKLTSLQIQEKAASNTGTVDRATSEREAAALFQKLLNTPLGADVNAAQTISAGESARRRQQTGHTLSDAEKAALSAEDRLDPAVKAAVMQMGHIIDAHANTLEQAARALGGMFQSTTTFQKDLGLLVQKVQQIDLTQDALRRQIELLGGQNRAARTNGAG